MRQHSGKKRLGAVLLSLALCLSLLPTAALAAGKEVKYLDYNAEKGQFETQTIEDYTEITSTDPPTNWDGNDGNEHWYVVTGEVVISGRITVIGDVNLILVNGCTLDAQGGINVASGNSLTIYAQSADESTMGKLTATGDDNQAGIGGDKGGNKDYAPSGTITINGGMITAQGGEQAAGIGGGYHRPGGTITINGGMITAWGGYQAAGIGGGEYHYGGTITINGGTVTAQGGEDGAGIGSGRSEEDDVGTTITISGGTVTATGVGKGAGIGHYQYGHEEKNSDFSTGENGHAVIFASGGINGAAINDQTKKDSWSGVIFQGNEGGKLYGDTVTPTEDFTIGENQTLTIETGKTLVIQEGVTLTNKGTINNSGTIDVYGTLTGNQVTGTPVNYKVTGVSLDKTSLTLTVGDEETLAATVQPENATNKNVTWESSDTSVATVDENGVVTAVGAGTATITVTTQDGDFTATCEVTVERPYTPPPANPNYRIDVTTPEHGTVTADPAAAKAGETVTLTPAPDAGYEVGSVTVTDRFGDTVAVTENPDGTYTFTMPSGQVKVEVTFVEATPEPVPFTDVNETDWFHDAVQYAYENGLMDGVGDGQFAPHATTNRAMVVTILYRLAGEPAVSGDSAFTDVAAGQWYSNAVLWAAEKGIVNGISETEFSPAGDLTREQLATILYRYAESMGYDVSASADLSSFPDAGDIQSYATEALSWAVAEGLLQGFEDDTLQPQSTATRAQIATILMRFCETVAK